MSCDKSCKTKSTAIKNVKKKLTHLATDQVDIPTLNVDTINKVEEQPAVNISECIEKELFKYQYVPLSTIVTKDNKHTYIKALNKIGQKVYILIEETQQNLDADLTLIETKTANILPYSLKAGAIKMAGMDVSGVAFECDKKGLCVLKSVMNDCDENVKIIESNFTFLEPKVQNAMIVENFGCYLSYPLVTLSEIRINNDLVVASTNMVTKKLRNASYSAYYKDLDNLQTNIKNLEVNFCQLKKVIEANALALNEKLSTLETWHKYYVDNPPKTECDQEKFNLIKHNMRLKNDYISYLLCGMKKITENAAEVDKLNSNICDFTQFFDQQLTSANCAANM
jgi:hypothetical protein